MKRNARKWLSRLITFALVLGLIPALGLTTLADGGDVTTVTTEADLRSALSAAGTATVRLGADITTSDVLTVKDTKTLDLNGYGIKANSTDEKIFSVISVIGLSATLNLTDSGTTTHYYYLDESGLAHVAESAEDPNYVNAKADYKSFFTGGYLTGGSGTDYGGYYIGGGVYVNNGTFNMEGGTILGNALGDGGGVCVLGRGSFTMNGGAILGNTANDYGGGGVFLYNPGSPIGPKFIMNGGKINYNSAPTSGTTPEQQAIDVVSGGGVYNFAGTFIMNGGEIRGNWAFTGGGGVENYYGGSFTMTGGTIEQNTASKYGGGVENCYGSTFNMEGGTIQQNEVYYHFGGGVGNYNSSTFTMTGGTIGQNHSYNYGGGVGNGTGAEDDSSIFTMSGGTIEQNAADKRSGGVENSAYSTFSLSGEAAISKNTAKLGGGVWNGGAFTMSGGTVGQNTADINGGGVWNIADTFTMSGGTIEQNTANSGGGVFMFNGVMEISGDARVTGNKNKSSEANNVYLPSGKTISVTCTLTDTALVGVSLQPDALNDAVITATDLAYFTSGYANYALGLYEGGVTEARFFPAALGRDTVTARLGSALLLAQYDASGKMTALQSKTLTADVVGASPASLGITLPTARPWKLMLVDGKTYAPLCASIEMSN